MTPAFTGFTMTRFEAFGAYDVILLNGEPQASDDISFNSSTYHFTNEYGTDITDLISRADKLQLVPGFDVGIENRRLSREAPARVTAGTQPAQTVLGPAPLLSADVFTPALMGIASDIRSGGGAAVSGIGSGVKSTVQTVVIFGIAGLVAYFLLKDKLKL